MKILQVVHGFPPQQFGGTEVYTQNLALELSRRHGVAVFRRICDFKNRDYALSSAEADNLQIFSVNNTLRAYDSFEMSYRNKPVAEKFAAVLDKFRPDIVHIQHLLYLGAAIIEEILKRKIPFVVTLHDYWLLCPQGQLFKNDQAPCRQTDARACGRCMETHLSIQKGTLNLYFAIQKTTPLFFVLQAKKLYLWHCRRTTLTERKATDMIQERQAYIRNLLNKADLLIAPSRFLKDRFVAQGHPGEKIRTIGYGFDMNRFKNIPKTRNERLRFGFIGNLLPAKGAHVALQCFNDLEGQDIELKVFAQDISYKNRVTDYVQKIKKITQSKNVRFMGSFENKNVQEVLNEIDVLIVPSLWYENSPLVIQEAFATKTPVIASRIGGIPELIRDGVDSLLFKPGDVADLREKVESFIKNPELTQTLGRNTPKIKSIEENAEEIERIYADIIARNNMTAASS